MPLPVCFMDAINHTFVSEFISFHSVLVPCFTLNQCERLCSDNIFLIDCTTGFLLPSASSK